MSVRITRTFEMIREMSESDDKFVLKGRVCWNQRMARAHVVPALGLLKTIATLHCHFGPGRDGSFRGLALGLPKIAEAVGRNVFRNNIRVFFDLVDTCWGIRHITFSSKSTHVKIGFLKALAATLGKHEAFWHNGKNLFIDARMRKKIAQFDPQDPYVSQVASSGGSQTGLILSQLLVDHINSGKRNKRLKRWADAEALVEVPEEVVDAGATE